jgi:hypothetical protein
MRVSGFECEREQVQNVQKQMQIRKQKANQKKKTENLSKRIKKWI